VLDSHATRALFDTLGSLRQLNFIHRICAADELYIVQALTRTTTTLHTLSLSVVDWNVENVSACMNLVAQHGTLTYLGIDLPANELCAAALCDMLTTTTKLASLNVCFDSDDDNDDAYIVTLDNEMILNALNNNYSLVDKRSTSLRWASFDFPRFTAAVGLILTRNQSLIWHNMHTILLDVAIVLLPLDLPVYVVLWVLDWLEPMSHQPDMHLLKKVRLIEGLHRSRAVVKAMRSVTNSDDEDATTTIRHCAAVLTDETMHRHRCVVV